MVQLRLHPPVETKNLFSRHYLDERLKDHPIWIERQEEIERVYKEIKELYDREKAQLPQYEEAQLEEHFIRPVLRKLGHIYEVQQPTYKSRMIPDYAFFRDDESAREAKNKGKKEFYQKAIAVGDAKKWGTPLDKKSPGKEKFVYDNPSFQIDIYLRDTDTKWAILTDGRFWRLYNQKTSARLDSYYEVDLASVLERGSVQDFKYFYLFFRKDAFLRDERGTNFLEQIYDQGVNYAKKVGEDLEKNIYKALEILAQGFLDWPANSLSPDQETIEKIHDNSLIFLYRLLFVLYADGRGMLSGLHKLGYEHYNINRLRAQAFEAKKDGALSRHSSALWDRLSALFQLIDEGSEARRIPKDDLFIPPYNGGLFHSKEHIILAEKKVGDTYVADVLELLTVPPDEDKTIFIDYSTLEIRHLGSIYEGLLEYKLRVAEEDLVAVKEKDKQIWIPKSKANGKKILDEARKGELYLVTDKGERKATGSYYTPDYIVKYIVENTLGPVVEEKLKGATTDEEKIERILSIKVLDPAMGSGHFLVEATDFLAEKIVQFVKPEQLRDEKEIEWARREVIKRCIYGVDLNHLATELAKLSLWLGTLEASRPLSFLDHHLKIGNSLIGAEIYKLDKHPSELKAGEASSQLSISSFMRASIMESIDKLLSMYNWIVERAEEKIADIKYKEQVFEELMRQPLRRRFVELANLHTSYYFGNEFTKDEYEEALRGFQDGEDAWNKIRGQEHFKRAQDIATEKDFFHWKLEFPEIFFEPGKEKENPGFDVVIGNPPYVRIYRGLLDSDDVNFWKNRFISAYMKFDLYVLFMDASIDLIKKKGYTAMIVPDKFMNSPYGEPLRNRILKETQIISILDLRDLKIFEEVAVSNVIPVFQKTPSNHSMFSVLTIADNEFVVIDKLSQDTFSFGDKSFRISRNLKDVEISNKIVNQSIPFSKIYYVNWGLRTGTEEKTKQYVVDSSEHPLARPMIRGENIVGRYELTEPTQFIIYDKDALYNPMFEEFFENTKIVFRKISGEKGLMAIVDNQNYYCFSTLIPCVNITHIAKIKRAGIPAPTPESTEYTQHYFFLAIVNSKLMSWYYNKNQSDKLSVVPNHIKDLPIRRISFMKSEKERTKLVSELKELYNASNLTQIFQLIDSYLPKDKDGNFITKNEKSDVVHDFLAFLAEQMIEMNKDKNKEIKDFFSWLKDVHGIDKEAMKPKTYLDEFYTLEAGAFFKHLEKNKIKPKPQDYSAIKETLEKTSSRIKPLVERIERTDRLIDQIVYKLYGLTEDEIRIVEAS